LHLVYCQWYPALLDQKRKTKWNENENRAIFFLHLITFIKLSVR